jgi:hypothetical protein
MAAHVPFRPAISAATIAIRAVRIDSQKAAALQSSRSNRQAYESWLLCVPSSRDRSAGKMFLERLTAVLGLRCRQRRNGACESGWTKGQCFKGFWMESLGSRRDFITLLAGALTMFLCVSVAAQEGYYGAGHDKWHQNFYSNLKRNDGQGSCCNLMDCRPTQSRMLGDHYEDCVILPSEG